MKVRKFKLATILILTTLTAACGGGGGGGGGSSAGGGSSGGSAPGTSSSAAVALSSSNSNAAAATVEDSLFLTTGVAGSTAVIPVGVVVTPAQRFNLADFVSAQLQAINNFKGGIASIPLGTVVTSSVACSAGGSLTITLDDTDNSGAFSTNDTMALTFNSCNEDGSVINGTMSAANVVLNKTSATAYTFSGAMSITNLTFTDGPDTGVINGSINFSESTSDSILITTTVSVSALNVALATETLAISGFTATVTDNFSTGQYTVASSGTVTSSKLGGSVTFTTPTTLRGVGSGYPSTGVVKVSGASSSLTMTALSSTSVRLDIDSNNDGTIDSTSTTTWAALESV